MRLGKFALVVAAGLLVAAPAVSQQPPGGGRGGRGGFGGFGGGLVNQIAQNKQLQDELKIDTAQVEKLTAALAKVREDLKDDLAKLRDRQTPAEDRTKIQKTLSDANEKAVETVLNPEQNKRLRQIENQQAGIRVFAKEEVQKTLKLTDTQKDKLDEISKELQKDLADLGGAGRGGAGGAGGRPGRGGAGGAGGGAFNPETITKRQELQKEAMTSAKKVLNDDQKTILTKDVLGAAFELQVQGFGGGAGFGGGRGTPGKVLSAGAQDQLKLTDEQKKKLEDIQKQVDEQLNKVLTEEQQKQLKDMQQGAPVGGTGRGGRGARGGNPPAKPNP
jgi:Spy/CpxP family protein refolding chaperone